MANLWAGLDLGDSFSHLCVVDDDGTVVLDRPHTSSPAELHESLLSVGALELIAVEAGAGTYIVRALRERGHPIMIFEARQASKVVAVRRNKTDASDARGLADVARLARFAISQVHLKSTECQRLRTKLALRQQLVEQRVAFENFIRTTLTLYGGKPKQFRSTDGLKRIVEAEVARIEAETRIDLYGDLQPMVEMCLSIRAFLTRLDRELKAFARNNPVCRRFLAIPGIGPVCAVSFFSAIEEPTRFERVANAAAYLGLTPKMRQSGTIEVHPRISRMGNAMTRSHLVMAARVVLSKSKTDTALRQWGLGLASRIGHSKARVAVARKLSQIMLSIWRSGASYQAFPVTGS